MSKMTDLIICRKPSNGMETEEIRWRLPSLLWLVFLICGVLIFVVDVFQLQYYYTISYSTTGISSDFFIDQKSLKGFLIKTPGCRIPHMDPFDQSIMRFIRNERPPKCNKGLPALVDSNLTSIFVVEASLPLYVPPNATLRCCYRAFYRKKPQKNADDNKVRFDSVCHDFEESVEIFHEFIEVNCDVGSNILYRDFFSFIPIKRKTAGRKPLNVLIIGLDAVSRLNLHRQMPKTVEFLRNISAAELLGYNKVGDNTFPNLIPVLTGLTEDELEKVCWKNDGKRFDNCPFIWKEFSRNGFLTSFGEDSSWMGIFSYMRKGFREQPTDYMWGIFNRISESEIGNSHNMNVEECVGTREVYKVFLNYIKNFVTKMEIIQAPYFAFYWGASLTHDFLNKPKLGDDSYHSFFKFLRDNNHLNTTAVVVMSDHGIRWGDIRQTYQGKMEERLPFLYLLLPKWYRRQYQDAYNNLLRNTRRLTTPFDLHETLKDFLNPLRLNFDFLQGRYNGSRRGYSLFNEITPRRTCEDAHIAAHWCTCQQSLEIDKNDTTAVQSSHFAVTHINLLLKGYAQCSKLELEGVLNARVMMHGDDISKGNSNITDYMITFKTLPGEGVFEATVRMKLGTNSTYQYEVLGTISRLNLYGQQSACITDFHLKLYCYCKRFF